MVATVERVVEAADRFLFAILKEYSPNQPRDSHGRFGSGSEDRASAIADNLIQHRADATAARMRGDTKAAAVHQRRADRAQRALHKANAIRLQAHQDQIKRFAKAGLTKRNAAGDLLRGPVKGGYFVADAPERDRANPGRLVQPKSGRVYSADGKSSTRISDHTKL